MQGCDPAVCCLYLLDSFSMCELKIFLFQITTVQRGGQELPWCQHEEGNRECFILSLMFLWAVVALLTWTFACFYISSAFFFSVSVRVLSNDQSRPEVF